MRKLKYVQLFESFYDEELLKNDKSEFIESIIRKLENNEELSFDVSIEETSSGNHPLTMYVTKPGVDKGKADGLVDLIKISGDSLKTMTQEQFDKLFNLLPFKGGKKYNRWAMTNKAGNIDDYQDPRFNKK